MNKRVIAVILSLLILFSVIPVLQISVSADSVIEAAISWAIAIANDNSHGYSQQSRWGSDYDCSSFVISAFQYAGINTGATYTGNMRACFVNYGFIWIPWSSIENTGNLQRGDILLNEAEHTEIYLGSDQIVGAHWHYGYTATGDQTGEEIDVRPYYFHPWDGVLRYAGANPTTPTVTFSRWDAYTSISETRASIGVHVDVFGGNFSEIGMTLYDENHNVVSTVWWSETENSDYHSYYFETDVDFHYTCKPGTTYFYAFTVNMNGAQYFSDEYTFTTTGSPPVNITKPIISVSAGKSTENTVVSILNNSSAQNTDYYEVKIFNASNNECVAVNWKCCDTSCCFKLPAGTYFATATAIDLSEYYSGNQNYYMSSDHSADFVVQGGKEEPTSTTSYKDNTYEYYNLRLTWDEAKAFCEKRGGHLVTITSSEEQDALSEMIKYANTYIWIGLTDNVKSQKWEWVTGEQLQYTNWYSGEPNHSVSNNFGVTEHYAHVGKEYGYQWNDVVYNHEGIHGFVCEYDGASVCTNGHSYTSTVTAPTCTGKGYTTYTCSVCGNSYVTVTEALGHDWNNGVITTQPTETTEGVKTFTCSRCGTTKTESVPVLDHTHTYTSTVTAPTCTAQGYTTYTCSCGDSYVTDYVAALGHDWGDGVVTTKPTEAKEGVKTFTCSRCGETRTESVPVLAHTHSYTAVVTKPTCTEKGYTTYTCACGDSYVADYVGALGHDFVDGTCSRCGAKDPNYKPIGPDKPCDGGASCPGKSFTDMPKPNNWAHAGIDFCVENGLFAGTSATTFSPNGNMTRAMLVTVLYRLEGQPAVTGNNPFTDVANNQWYTNAVIWAAGNGVVNGVGEGRFDPDANITREQMAAILYRYAQKKGFDTTARADLKTYPDYGEISAYARDSLSWANVNGLINGTTGADGKTILDPQGNATRAQVAAILMRYVKNIVQK